MEYKRELESKAKALINIDPNQALILYRQIWNEFLGDYNSWDAFHTLKILRLVENPDIDWALEIAKKYEDEKVKNFFAWLIFDNCVKNRTKIEILKNEKIIIALCDIVLQKNLREDDSYPCPVTISIFKVIDAYSENLFNAKKINEWLGKLQIDRLSEKSKSIQSEQRGKIEIASDLEKYFALKTKSLIRLEKFEECHLMCKMGLDEVERFHYNNDLWLKMRLAICEEKTGNPEECEKLFKELITSKAGSDKWFLYQKISELYYEQKNYETAWKYAVDAAFYGNEPEYMLGLFLLQSRLLYKLDRAKEGKILAELICSVLKEKDWNSNTEYEKLFVFFKIEKETIEAVRTYIKSAKKFWSVERYGDMLKQTGKIISINRNGKGGRIKNEKGQVLSFYKKDFEKKQRNLDGLQGGKVEFYSMIGYDDKPIAENISIIKKINQPGANDLVGKIVEGKVKSVVEFGVFVGLKGYSDGLLHKTNLPQKLRNNFKTFFNRNDQIKIEIVKVTAKGMQLKYIG